MAVLGVRLCAARGRQGATIRANAVFAWGVRFEQFIA